MMYSTEPLKIVKVLLKECSKTIFNESHSFIWVKIFTARPSQSWNMHDRTKMKTMELTNNRRKVNESLFWLLVNKNFQQKIREMSKIFRSQKNFIVFNIVTKWWKIVENFFSNLSITVLAKTQKKLICCYLRGLFANTFQGRALKN